MLLLNMLKNKRTPKLLTDCLAFGWFLHIHINPAVDDNYSQVYKSLERLQKAGWVCNT